jgi:uncharacterized protein
MAVTVSYPGVYIQEVPSAVRTIAGVATSITAFVGYSARGIDNRAEQIFSFADYERSFGALASDSELSYTVQQFFVNGGTQAYVVRVPRAGAAGAQVTFDQLTFSALSSGSWANGQLLLDVDYNNLYQTLAGAVTVIAGSTTVGGSGFQSALKAGQWLVFASDPNHTPYQIQAIGSDTSLTLATAFTTGPNGATTATISNDPTAFNLTITKLVDGTIDTVEPFPNVSLNSNRKNYIIAVVNDSDNGSALVNGQIAGAPPTNPPTISGIVGAPLTIGAVNVAVGALAGTVNLIQHSAAVIGAGTSFTTALNVGQSVVFGSDPASKAYQVGAIADDTHLTLTSTYTSPNAANSTVSLWGVASKDFGLQLSTSSPPTPPPPFPLAITMFRKNAPVPQTVSSLATQLQQVINTALAVKMPGASVACSVSAIGTGQSIRVNALIPQFPDAVLTFPAPSAGGPADASTILGLATPTSSNVAHYALGTGNGSAPGGNGWGGQQTSSRPGSDGSGLPGTAELIGDEGLFTGIYALNKVDLFNLLSIPDATRASAGNPSALDNSVDPNTIYSAAIALCIRRRAFLLLDSLPNVNTVSGAHDWKVSGLTVHDDHGAAFFPRLRLQDPLNNLQLRTFAPSGVVAGLYARIDSSRGVWKAPAGTEATLSGVQSLVYKLNDAENGALNPLGLNCFRTFPIYGTVLWGARTLTGADADASQWKYVPVRRVALYIEESLYRGTQWVVFEPNDEPLWAAIRLNVGAFMQDLFRKGAFQGKTPAEAYFVKCDHETTTQDDIDLGIVNILVGFAPLKPAEFVVIQIQQMAGQTQ